MNTDNLSFGQRIDPENNLVELWLTHGALDWIKQQDWSDKNVTMFGCGMGDSWLAKRCASLTVIERNKEWFEKSLKYAMQNNVPNISYLLRECNDSSGKADYYLELPSTYKPDIIISDDAYRSEAVFNAIEYFKNKEGGGILICDNYNQSYIWRSPSALEALEPFEKLIFEQPDHEDYNKELEPDGKWKTAIIFIK